MLTDFNSSWHQMFHEVKSIPHLKQILWLINYWQNFTVSWMYAQELYKRLRDSDVRGVKSLKPLSLQFSATVQKNATPLHQNQGGNSCSRMSIINLLTPWQSSLLIVKERIFLISSQDRRWSLSIIPSSWSLLPESPHQQNCLSEQTAGGKGLTDW